jgi:hypothetical protein
MKTGTLLGLLLTLLAIPQTLVGQTFAIGARAGTLGFGAEAALGLSDHLVVRGGLGSFIFDFTGDYGDVEYTVTPPSMTGTLGIDLYPGIGSFRFMAGIMFRDGDFEMESGNITEHGPIEIGDGEYSEPGTLHGTLATKSTAPFLGIGFGRHTEGGFGFFVDLGVAFVGEAEVTLEAQGPIATVPGFQEDLEREAQYIEDEAAPYLKYWPILSLGVKIPFN